MSDTTMATLNAFEQALAKHKATPFECRSSELAMFIAGMEHGPAKNSEPKIASDNRKLSDIGNELHNLSCQFQDSEVGEQLSALAIELWNWEGVHGNDD